jgi:hypothetical protein
MQMKTLMPGVAIAAIMIAAPAMACNDGDPPARLIFMKSARSAELR